MGEEVGGGEVGRGDVWVCRAVGLIYLSDIIFSIPW